MDLKTILNEARKHFDIVSAKDISREDIISFLKNAYSGEFNAGDYKDEELVLRRWKWANIDNPNISGGLFPSWFAVDKTGHEIAGHAGSIPVIIKVKNGYYPAIWGRDMIVLKKFRKRGIATLLFSSVMDQIKDRCRFFLLAGANDYAVAIYKNIGFKHLGFIPLYVMPLDTGNIIDGLSSGMPALRLSKPFVRWFCNIYRRITSSAKKRAPDITVKEIQDFDGSFDDFWERSSGRYNMIIKRGARELPWRFIDQPFRRYIVFKAEGSDGRLRGYTVLRESKNRGLKAGVISDLLVAPDDHEATAALLDFIVDFFRDVKKVDLIHFRILSPVVERAALRAGFFKVRSNSHLLMAQLGDPGAGEGLSGDKNNWFLTGADSDLDLSN